MTIFCQVCNEEFSNRISLIRHRRCLSPKCKRHQSEVNCFSGSLIAYLSQNSTFKTFECTKCNKKFLHVKHLLIHQRIHTKRAPYKCDFCSKSFMLILHLYKHLNSHQDDNLHRNNCAKCILEIQELLHKFNTKARTVRSLICLYCKKRNFSNISQFIVHLRIHCRRSSVCSDCGQVFVSFQNVVSSMQDRRVSAQIRGLSCRRPSNAKSSDVKRFQCGTCEQIFPKVHLLELHLISHISDPLFCCTNCQEVFRNERLYRIHVRKCLNKIAFPSELFVTNRCPIKQENYDCPYCEAAFGSASKLLAHLPLHSVVKASKSDTESAEDEFLENDPVGSGKNNFPNYVSVYVCSNCGQVFRKREEFSVHVRTQCPCDYNCEYCLKNFGERTDLEEHLKNRDCLGYQSDNSVEQRSRNQNQNPDSGIRHLCPKSLHRCDKCSKLFVNSFSLESHSRKHFASGLPSLPKTDNGVSLARSSGYLHPESQEPFEKENGKEEISKSFSDQRCLCDVCGEVFWSLLNLNHHMKMHSLQQEVGEPIYTTAKMTNPRQPDINSSHSSMTIFPQTGVLTTPCFISNSKSDNVFHTRQDVNANFARVGNISPMSHQNGYLTIQTNNYQLPAFTTSNALPFMTNVNELKNVPFANLIPGFPFHAQNNNRGSFFPFQTCDDNQRTESACGNNNYKEKPTPFSYNETNKYNNDVFYSVPAQQDVLIVGNRNKTAYHERTGTASPLKDEDEKPNERILSPFVETNPNDRHFAPTLQPKINNDFNPYSSSVHPATNLFMAGKEALVNGYSPQNNQNIITNLDEDNSNNNVDNNQHSLQVSYSESKTTHFQGKKTQNPVSGNMSTIPMIKTTTTTNNNNNTIENPNLDYSVNELLINLPNLSQASNQSVDLLPEIEPLNLCQSRNVANGKCYNYPVDMEPKTTSFFAQPTPTNDLADNMASSSYPVQSFWGDGPKSYLELSLNVDNPCCSSENESTMKFNSGFQIENLQPSFWNDGKTFYNMNHSVPFRDSSYIDVGNKIGKMSSIRNKQASLPNLVENRNMSMNSMFENLNCEPEKETVKAESYNLEFMPFLRLKPNSGLSTPVSSRDFQN